MSGVWPHILAERVIMDFESQKKNKVVVVKKMEIKSRVIRKEIKELNSI